MKRFLGTAFLLVVLAAVSASSRQNVPAKRSAMAAQGGLGWKAVEQGMELRFLEAQKEGVQSNSPIAILRIDPALWDLEGLARAAPVSRADTRPEIGASGIT